MNWNGLAVSIHKSSILMFIKRKLKVSKISPQSVIKEISPKLVDANIQSVLFSHPRTNEFDTLALKDYDDYLPLEDILPVDLVAKLIKAIDQLASDFERKVNNRWDGKEFVSKHGVLKVTHSTLYLRKLKLYLEVGTNQTTTYEIPLDPVEEVSDLIDGGFFRHD